MKPLSYDEFIKLHGDAVLNYGRRMGYDRETIMLSKTVEAFSAGYRQYHDDLCLMHLYGQMADAGVAEAEAEA